MEDANEVFLGTLISDRKAQTAAFRQRNSQYDYTSVSVGEVEGMQAKGWEIQRLGKSKCRLRREKNHNERLEDRLWCLLYRMGYRFLSGERFVLKFKRDDGSVGQKQIDAFACDEETALVIECKSREERGRRNLQKDILETIALQNYIRRTIFKLYDSTKPKIIWAYATNNILWSEPDVERANDGNISILTENEVQYFETFIKHMGPAGKFQVLGDFLRGQKIPGLGDVRLPAIRGNIGGETFFSFVITPRRLLKISFVNHQALNHPDGRPAYQRMISSSRITEIGKFIRQGGYFPTNVIVNFTERPRFDLISNKENVDPNIKFGWLTLPTKYRSAWIIDSQHRLYGYSHLSDEFLDQSLFVVAFQRMSVHKEADLFITINHKQKSVPRGLLVSLLADIRMGDPDPKTAVSALASAVIRSLNNDRTSPLARRFAIPDVPAEPTQNLTISEAVNGLTRSGLLGKVVQKTLLQGPMSGATDGDTIERARRILNGYFERLRAANPNRWEAGKSAFIAVNPGIRAHLMLMGEIIRYLQHKKNVEFRLLEEGQFVQYIFEVSEPVLEFIRSASDDQIRAKFSRKFGEGGVREYLYNLCELIFDRTEDFGSEEFRRYMSQKESNRFQEADRLIIEFSEKMMNFVIDTLKKIHGTKLLESGEPQYWELGIQSRRVKDNAYRKQQEDPSERRKRKEAYLDVIDLKDIVEQNNNWHNFAHVFNLPRPNERNGKKFYTSWITEFNELRRIPAHPSALRSYSDEDFEFLDWLRSEALSKLDAALEPNG